MSPVDLSPFLYSSLSSPDIYFVHQGSNRGLICRCHMFYGRRVLDIPDGKPKWTGLNNKSDLIEDSPPGLKRKREKEDKQEKEGKREQEGEREKEDKN